MLSSGEVLRATQFESECYINYVLSRKKLPTDFFTESNRELEELNK